MVNGKWIGMDELLEQEFGPPRQVIERGERELRQRAEDSLTGMAEEQAEWEGPPGDMHEPRGYTRRSSLDWPDDDQ
jgi:hypothetical protein